MIKLIAIERKDGTDLVLRFSDGAWGVYDFSRYLGANTDMWREAGRRNGARSIR